MLYYYISYYSAVTDTKTSSIIELLLSPLYPIFFFFGSTPKLAPENLTNYVSAKSFGFLISNVNND